VVSVCIANLDIGLVVQHSRHRRAVTKTGNRFVLSEPDREVGELHACTEEL